MTAHGSDDKGDFRLENIIYICIYGCSSSYILRTKRQEASQLLSLTELTYDIHCIYFLFNQCVFGWNAYQD